jgi:4-amino-4-deoxy-L-arabinose transferase-like glycosyltransferase
MSYPLIAPDLQLEKQGRRDWLTMAQSVQKFAPWAVFALALLLNLLTIWSNGFDGLYGQDAYSYFAHAGELYSRQSLFHHWQWEATPRILYWPFGYPGLVALLFFLTGPTPGAAQFVSIICWAGVAGLVTAIAQSLWGNRFGLAGPVAGLLIALSPLGRQVAISVMSDAAALFWTTLGIWLALRATSPKLQGRLNYWYAIGSGLALGLGGITRYSALTALPLLLVFFNWQERATRKSALQWVGLAFGVAALVYLPQFIINQLYPERFWYNSWLDGWSPLNAFQTSFTTRDGFAAYDLPPLLFYAVYPFLNLHFFTPGVIILVGAGLVALWQRRNRLEILLLAGWWLLPVLALSVLPYESERYSLTFMPPIALVAGLGANWLWNWLWSRPKLWRQFGLGLAGLALLGLGLISQRHVNGFMAVKAADLATVRQVTATLPPQSTLITFEVSLTFDRYTDLKIRDLWFLDPAQVTTLVGQQPNVYLLADSVQMAKQWTGNHVGEAFAAAQNRAKGEPVAKIGRYWLWRLG